MSEIVLPDEGVREFLESLSSGEIGVLMDTPKYAGVVFDHAEESVVITDKITQVLDEEYESMTPEERQHLDSMVERLKQKYASSAQK